MESTHGDGSNQNRMDSPEGTFDLDHEQILLSSSKKSTHEEDNSDSSSSSSDSSSAENFLKSDGQETFLPTTDISHGPTDIPQFTPKHDSTVDNRSLLRLEKQPPPVQTMGRSDVPDPNRIPLSVFARTKSTAPMEWSVASNESLFSIHMGNSSFSRDHIFLVGRSQELSFPPSPPRGVSAPPTVAPHDTKNFNSRERLETLGVAKSANAETMKEVLRVVADEQVKEEPASPGEVRYSSSVSRHSNGSATSTNSFAFPILAHGRSGSVGGESEHQHHQQSQPKPQSQPQPQNLEAAPAATPQNKWFSCFSCCTFCS